jgi:pimeloyl-ACP methyl ester carboxylesterase
MRTQLSIAPQSSRLAAYQNVQTPALVIGFADDVVLPSYLGREVANAMPNATFLEIPGTGHLGFIEKPQVVNTAILNFFADTL